MNDTKSTIFTRHVYDRFAIPPELCSSEFVGFTHRVWLDNCDEKESWNEPKYSYEEYYKKNFNFLLEKFKKRT